jgi:hypothetical protein
MKKNNKRTLRLDTTTLRTLSTELVVRGGVATAPYTMLDPDCLSENGCPTGPKSKPVLQ